MRRAASGERRAACGERRAACRASRQAEHRAHPPFVCPRRRMRSGGRLVYNSNSTTLLVEHLNPKD
eukprot:3479758-Prymnesium_polylepis.1